MGLSGTGRSREPGSGEVSDSGETRGRSCRGACERGAWRRGTRCRLPRAFRPLSPSLCHTLRHLRRGWGGQRWGSCFPHLLLPSRPASRSRQCLGRGSKQSGRSCTSSSPGLSPSESRCQDAQRVGPFSAGSAFPSPAPTWRPVRPESALGDEAFWQLSSSWRARRSRPGRASRAGPAGSRALRERLCRRRGPGTRRSRESWQRSAPPQLLRGRRDLGAEVSRCL